MRCKQGPEIYQFNSINIRSEEEDIAGDVSLTYSAVSIINIINKQFRMHYFYNLDKTVKSLFVYMEDFVVEVF